jgi:tetratricopeptide (TPR) repeat protein
MELIDKENEWDKRDIEPDTLLWNERSVSELDELIAERRTEYITAAWPFAGEDLTVSRFNGDDTLQQIAECVSTNKCGWGDAHLSAINFYRSRHDWKNLESEYKVMISLLPNDVNAYLNLAVFYINQQRYMNAERILKKSLLIKKTAAADKLLQEIEVSNLSYKKRNPNWSPF